MTGLNIRGTNYGWSLPGLCSACSLNMSEKKSFIGYLQNNFLRNGHVAHSRELRIYELCGNKIHATVELIDGRGQDACARHRGSPRWEYTLTRLG